MDDLIPELRQGGGGRGRRQSEDRRLLKVALGAPVTARTLTRRPITGPEDGSTFLLSLFPFRNKHCIRIMQTTKLQQLS